jgi:hypothetical protein
MWILDYVYSTSIGWLSFVNMKMNVGGPINDQEFVDCLSDHQLVKKDSDPYSKVVG